MAGDNKFYVFAVSDADLASRRDYSIHNNRV
jgi:hypothetical protein